MHSVDRRVVVQPRLAWILVTIPLLSGIVIVLAAAANADDPTEAWSEWDETVESRRVPRRQREIVDGMDIRTVLGMADRKRKLFLAHVREGFAPSQAAGEALASRFFNMLNAGGVACQMRFFITNEASPKLGNGKKDAGLRIAVDAETIRDAHEVKWFLLKQREIEAVVMDDLPSTPAPQSDDDDDDNDL
jgi:hypothetical protein